MSEIVLLGLSEDHDRIRPVVDALHANRLDFWWERDGPGTAAAAARIAAARCVVLFLTRASLADERFMSLATQAVVDGKAIGARLEKVATPARLAGITVVDLAGFKGSKDDLFLVDLASAASAKAKGIDPPPPRGPVSRLTKRILAFGSVGFVLAAAVVGIVADSFGASSGLGELWSRFDRGQKAAYEKADSCEALRDFARGREGYYANLARARFENPRLVDGTQRVDFRTSAYVMRNGLPVSNNRQAAEAVTNGAMELEAAKVCRGRSGQRGAKLITSRFEADSWSCEPQSGGVVCGLLAEVVCTVDQPTKVEDCGPT